jgi:hypothetical protein
LDKAKQSQLEIKEKLTALTSSANESLGTGKVVNTPLSRPRSSQTYNISDLLSDDDSSDDEFYNGKKIPEWAEGNNLRQALYEQFKQNINPREIFSRIQTPDLDAIFANKKPRFKLRSSSACWTHTPLSFRKKNF